MPARGNIVVRSRYLQVDIALLGSAELTHRAEMALRADATIREALRQGKRALLSRDGVVFVATARRGVVDEALLDEVVRVVDRLPVEVLSATATSSATSTATFAGPSATTPPVANVQSSDALARLRQLSELHRDGALTDEEFAEKKAALLKRV